MAPRTRQISLEFGWEFEKSKGRWSRYNDEISKKLTARMKQKETTISVDNRDVKVDYNSLMQKSTDTGFQRMVRCVVKIVSDAGDIDFFAWEYLDDGIWHSFSAKIIAQLEVAHRNKGAQISKLSVEDYEFDFDSMKVLNGKKACQYDFRRIRSDAVEYVDSALEQNDVQSNGSLVKGLMSDELAKRKRKGAKDDVEPKTKVSKAEGTTQKQIDKPDEAKAEKSEKNDKTKDGEDEKRGKKSTTAKKSKKAVVQANGEESVDSQGPKKKKLLIKGRAPIDPECKAKLGKAQVYFDNDDVYDCMLNQTNIQGNNNKYYIIQLLEDEDAKIYSVWQRWGRVGFNGQSNLVNCGTNLQAAKDVFCKKFYDKTKNQWGDRKHFEKMHGKYDMIELDYSNQQINDQDEGSADSKSKGDTESKEIVESKLDIRLQDLLKLICDVKLMEQTVREMEYDSNKLPLGKLTKLQIKAGYEALKQIEALLDKSTNTSSVLAKACSEFYTRIPHAFGMKVPPLIRDKIMLKQKLDLLETLSDIEVAVRILKEESAGQDMHPLDKHYSSIKREVIPLDHTSDEFKMIGTYITNTHAKTHNLYKLKLLDVFACSREEEQDQFMKDVGNRMLLWHGSRLSNWFGILSQGLRVAPPEAPCTGYMFGKGVYFADCASKSTNYCFATRSKNVGFAVLCEVALGKCNELLQADYNADKLPPGYHSTKGLGRVVPNPKAALTMKDGVVVPLGELISATPANKTQSYALNYNEYIVYNTKQILIRYLVKIEFDFL